MMSKKFVKIKFVGISLGLTIALYLAEMGFFGANRGMVQANCVSDWIARLWSLNLAECLDLMYTNRCRSEPLNQLIIAEPGDSRRSCLVILVIYP